MLFRISPGYVKREPDPPRYRGYSRLSGVRTGKVQLYHIVAQGFPVKIKVLEIAWWECITYSFRLPCLVYYWVYVPACPVRPQYVPVSRALKIIRYGSDKVPCYKAVIPFHDDRMACKIEESEKVRMV